MALGLALFFALVAGIVWFWKASPKPALEKQANHTPTKIKTAAKAVVKDSPIKKAAHPEAGSHPFHAVSIKFKSDACAAVKEIASRRFLTRDAPSIPLNNCDAAHCRCGYFHHCDRRDDEGDRRIRYSIQTELYRQTADRDQRKSKGRRETDSDT